MKAMISRSLARFSIIIFGATLVTLGTWGLFSLHLRSDAFAGTSSQSRDMADVAEAAVTSVVNISTTRVVRQDRSFSPRNDPFFEYFMGPRGMHGMPREQRSSSLGSGVLVSGEGIILTSNHVIDQAEDIKVTLFDGRELEAELVGADAKSDLAVLRLKNVPKDLRPMTLGDSDRMRLGESVLAIGNPFGLGHTVTQGIISAKGRANMGIVDYEDFIQTDAAINPGNSGGALINSRGELVGINTAIISRSGGYQGIGFAIPSNMVQGVMTSILANGRMIRGWLGVMTQDADKDVSEALELSDTRGALVADVMEDSPAAGAGLKRGDLILAVDGEVVDGSSRLRNIVSMKLPGKEVTVTVLRGGKKQDISVKLGEFPSDELAVGSSDQGDETGGLSLARVTKGTREEFNLPKNLKTGLVVTGVKPGSRGHKAGLKPGDVIIEANRREVSRAEDLAKTFANTRGRVLMLVLREGYTLFMAI